jgi:hypothetical protein
MMANLKSIGSWAAVFSAGLGIAYSVPQILSAVNLIPHPQDLYWLFTPSLLLAPAFLVTMICLHYAADSAFKLLTAIGVAFAVLYAADVTIVYFTQLTMVLPAQLENEVNEKQVLLFDRRTFLMAIDCLGYFFMSLSTLFAAFAFRGEKNKWLYRGLLYNGLLLPVLILAFFYPAFYYAGAVWMITFPLAMVNAARLFTNDSQLGLKLKMKYENE